LTPRKRIFYGWYVLGVAMVGAFLCGGLTSSVFFSVILKPLTADLGWSRSQVTGAVTLATIASAVMAPAMGILADRYGPRVLAPIGASVVALSLLAIGQLQSLVVFYAAYIVARGFSGSAVTGVVSQTLAANWFRRMRGRSFGLISMSVPLGGSFAALIAQPLVEAHGWRSVFLVFPPIILACFVVPALLVYRRRPEDVGLLPDGDVRAASAPETGESARASQALEDSWSLAEAMRTKTLWLLTAGMTIGTLAGGTVSFHLVAYYTDKGMSAGVGALAVSLYALFGAVAALIWGFLVERMSERLLLVAAMTTAGVTLLIMVVVQTAPPALVAAAIYGTAARGEGALVNTMLANYYGRGSYGRIVGFVSPFNSIALGIGPLIASLSFDTTGSYDGVFALFGVITIGAVFLLWFARKPERQHGTAEAPATAAAGPS
jgi:sugar phosphate permease